MFYSRNQIIQRTLIAVNLLAIWAFVTTADEPQANSRKPQYERLLQRDDAKLAEELGKKIEDAEEADQFDEAVKLSERLLELRVRLQGADHWETVNQIWALDSLRKVAALGPDDRAGWRKVLQGTIEADRFEEKGEYAQAEPLWEEYHRLCLAVLGEKHSATAFSYTNLATNLNNRGKYADAQPLFQKALDLRREVLGDNHPDTASSYNKLGLNLNYQRKYADAQPHYQKALELHRELFGEKDPRTATSYDNLAANLHARGMFRDAHPHFQKALDLFRELLGEQHSDTALSYNNLATNLIAQGRYWDAQTYLQKALELNRELQGEKHQHTAVSYNNLAANLEGQTRYADARPLFQKALDINCELFGNKHRSMATGYNNLGMNLYYQGKYADAQPLLQRSFDLNRELLGEEHPDTTRSFNNLALNLDAQGKHVDAQRLFRKTLELRRKGFGETHPATILSYNNLAFNLYEQGKFADAQPVFEKALALFQEVVGENHPQVALSYDNLARNLDAQRKYDDAQTLHQKAISLRVELFGEFHRDTANSYNNLAVSLNSQGKYADANPYYEKALKALIAVLGEKHPDTARSYSNFAYNLSAQGKYADALPLLANSAKAYEAARLGIAARGLDRAVFGDERSPYSLLAAAEVRHGAPFVAWVAAEADLARGLNDDIAVSRKMALTEEEQTRRTKLTSQLNALQPEIVRLVSKKDLTDDERKALAQIQAERAMLEAKLAELAALLSQREIASLSELQGVLAASAALVMWIDVSDQAGRVSEHWGCIVRHTGEPRWERLAGTGAEGQWTDDDSALAAQLRAALVPANSAQADIDELTRELYAQRLAPLAKHLEGIKALYVAGVNQMAGIPIEVLIRDFTISYIPSGTFLARLPLRDRADNDGLLALGDAVFTRPDTESKPNSASDLPDGGVLITQIAPDGEAAKAQLQPGDVLVRYGDTNLNSLEQLTAAIQELATAKDRPKEIPVTVWREGETELITCSVPPGRLGVGLSNEPAPDVIAGRRQTDAMLAQLRGGNWNELPGTRAEVTQIGKLFGNRTTELLDSAASEQSLEDLRQKGELSKFRYLHFATHGEANNVKAFESALILAQDKLPKGPLPRAGEPFINGQLSASEVLEFWDLNAELVTLSACETALGRKGGGDGLLGFAQAFLKAGSRAVCLSLWKVDDTATALLMTRFYQNLLGKRPGLDKPMPKAESLAEAKKWLRELSMEEAKQLAAGMVQDVNRQDRGKGERLNLVVPPVDPTAPEDKANKPFAHPRYWSAFILIGDPN
jgi:CHAT domain-containing protein/Flp pilus assembly protein TadD